MARVVREPAAQEELSLAGAPCFIEHQFPVARVSAESYKERKANYSQTLTGLGKWWGRKPLVLVRAALLGLLLPPTEDPKKDRDIFLKLMTMDEEGLWRRKDKAIPQERLIEELQKMAFSVHLPAPQSDLSAVPGTAQAGAARQAGRQYLDPKSRREKPQLRPLSKEQRDELQRLVFHRMPYSEKLRYCCRPEQIDGPSAEAWKDINEHLGTNAKCLPGLIEELGRRRFGRRPRVGDSFCGAGSVPFEAARLGCDAYGSDLSPVAALLTWAALNIVGGGEEVARQVREAQQTIFESVDRQVTEWSIEHNEKGWCADAYLYCVEVVCPECGWRVPLAPSWVIGEKTKTIAILAPDKPNRRFVIQIREGVSDTGIKASRGDGTVRDSYLHCPNKCQPTSIETIRRNLRLWENDDVVPRSDDIFQERLYCIRWVETYYERKHGKRTVEMSKVEAEALADYQELLKSGELKEKTRRHYRAPTAEDLRREGKVLGLLTERFPEWQAKGYIPSRRIEPGVETTRLQRERGWTYWHHLFTPRQLLVLGCLNWFTAETRGDMPSNVGLWLAVARSADWNSKLCRWHPHGANEKSEQTFSNQALNTLNNYALRPLLSLETTWSGRVPAIPLPGFHRSEPRDARTLTDESCIWITDPPYADAINYHELGEFFLAWYDKHLPKLFPDWYTDSKRALAIKGDDPVEFRKSMVECYRRLVENMPENGLQVVMFTHQDASVWADLTMILWAAGLRVTAAWCIATETDSALKEGNYVQGTVLLVCRKRTEAEPVFLDEIAHRVEIEVRRQLDTMLVLDDASEPNFGDADYQLAAYAAALRVLTERPIEDINPEREMLRVRSKGEISPVEQLIRNAVKIACDHLVPKGIDRDMWKSLSPLERFYLKGLEVEAHGEHRVGVYQELARGFGAAEYDELFASTKANETRLKTASEFARQMLSGDGFAATLVRQVLFSVFESVKSEEINGGRNYLKTEVSDYWTQREKMIEILDYLAALGRVSGLDHWRKDAEAATLLAGALRNDHV